MTQPRRRHRANEDRSPTLLRKDLRRISYAAVEIVMASNRLVKAHLEAYEAGLTQGTRGDITSARGTGFEDTDPTPSTVFSIDHHRLREATRFVDRSVQRALRELDRAEDALVDVFLDIDPDLRADRIRRRQEARATAEEIARKEHESRETTT